MTTLNLNANQNLVFLKCSDNNLTKLDVSKMYYLRQLMCSDNHLNYLNVANGINQLFYEPYCFSKTPIYMQHLHYPYINSVVGFPDVFPCFDARNNPNLKTIIVDYGFKHQKDEWFKDNQTKWDREIEDNRQREGDPFFKRHESAANSPFSKKNKGFMDVLATKDTPLFYCDDVYYEKEYDEEHDGANEHIVFIGKDVSNDYLMVAAAFSRKDTMQFDYIDVKERAKVEETVSSYSSMPEEFFKDVYSNFGKDILVNFSKDKESGFDF